jgi:hypothetical protein
MQAAQISYVNNRWRRETKPADRRAGKHVLIDDPREAVEQFAEFG